MRYQKKEKDFHSLLNACFELINEKFQYARYLPLQVAYEIFFNGDAYKIDLSRLKEVKLYKSVCKRNGKHCEECMRQYEDKHIPGGMIMHVTTDQNSKKLVSVGLEINLDRKKEDRIVATYQLYNDIPIVESRSSLQEVQSVL